MTSPPTFWATVTIEYAARVAVLALAPLLFGTPPG